MANLDTAETIAANTVTAIEGTAAAVYVDSWYDSAGMVTHASVAQSGSGIGLVNLSDVTSRLDIHSNITLETVGLASMNDAEMTYLYVTSNSSLNHAIRKIE